MATQNLGRVRGSMWYAGKQITGVNSSGTTFPLSGVTKAYVNDMYLNTATGTDSAGNVYICTVGGAVAVAEWAYLGNIEGPMPDLENGFDSTDVTKALTAYAGKRINDKIENSSAYPTILHVNESDTVYTLKITISNVTTTLTIKSATKTGTYSYTATGTDSETELTIPISTSIGLTNGAVLESIESSSAKIYSYTLLDSSSATIKTVTPNVWKEVYELQKDLDLASDITDGTTTYKTAEVSKLVDDEREDVFPVTHCKAVWMSIADNETVYDRLTALGNENVTEAEVKALTW